MMKKYYYRTVKGKRKRCKMPKRSHIRHSTHKEYPQSGKRKSLKRDRIFKAKHPGWRVSKAGKKYFENRRNRSDSRGTRT